MAAVLSQTPKYVPNRTNQDIIQSASVTALMRALLAEQKGILKNPDMLAKYFVNETWRPFLADPQQSIAVLDTRAPGTLGYILLRTKYFDNSLLSWLKTTPRSQVVILGTGFDTRSIRFSPQLREATVYEVDLEAMLKYKMEIIDEYGLDHQPADKIYVPVNFHTESILDKLTESGLKVDDPTYFLWEGVTYFLSAQTVRTFLKNLTTTMMGPTKLAFDYVFSDYVAGNLNYYGAKEVQAELEKLGEPHIFGINYDELDRFVQELGYQSRNNFTSTMLESLYLDDAQNANGIRPNSFSAMTEIDKQ